MAKVTFSNHAALRVRPGERERIRKFYGDVLGCKLNRQLEDKDDFRIGEDYYISFLYGGPGGKEPDEGAVYAQADALSDDDFLKAIYLELKTDDVQGMRQRIRLQEDKCSGWSVSTRTSRNMRGTRPDHLLPSQP